MHAFNQRDIAGIFAMIRTLGALVDAGDKTETLVTALQEKLYDIQAASSTHEHKPRIYFEEWDEPMISGIRWVCELIEIAGGIDVFPDLVEEEIRVRTHRLTRSRDRRRAGYHHWLMVRQEIRAG